MQHFQKWFISLTACCITCSAQTAISSSQQLQHRRTPQTLHLPPAPINPFRGGLSVAHNENDSISNEDRHDSINNSNFRHAPVEARSRNDYNPHRHHSMSSSSIQHAANHNIKTYPSWTPEDFPDPWTNPLSCGGAATAAQLQSLQQIHTSNNTRTQEINDSTPIQQQGQHMKTRPLLCDPDQVLDEPTLRDVMTKLMEFSREFASRTYVEGGEFGWWDVGVTEDTTPTEDGEVQTQPEESIGVELREGMDGNDNANDEERSDETTNDTRGRRLRHHHVISNQDDIPITNHRQLSSHNKHTLTDKDTIEVAIALVQKINLPAILRADSYFFYSDQDDMVNDAAQYFARYVHDTWNKRVMQEQSDVDATTNIVLIFISVHDRICYISSGTRIASILPWWRLEHVVQDMKPMLRKGQTGDALQVAIDDMTSLIRSGSPTVKDRVDDFFTRFGVVLAFAFFTFLFATYGEFQDRRQRINLAERRSHMNDKEREKARSLQQEFQTKVCPICLEAFGGFGDEVEKDGVDMMDDAASTSTKESITKKEEQTKLKRVDSYGIPRKGNDGRPIKLLRCGHIFDESCWEMWVDSGHSNAMMCPVCRQDIGRKKKRNRSQDADVAATSSSNTVNTVNNNSSTAQQSLFFRIMEHAHAATAPATLLGELHANYSSTTSTSWSTATYFDAQERVNDSSESSLYPPTETTPLI